MKLAVLISFSGAGGVEKMVMNLVREFAERVSEVDLLIVRAAGPHLTDIPENVNLIRLRSRHTLTAIPEIARYFRARRPHSMLVAKDRAARAAIIARKLAASDTRIVVRLGTHLSTALAHRSRVSAWLRKAPMKRIYRHADKIIAVSEGVARDTCRVAGVDENKVVVIRNPVITRDFFARVGDTGSHPWLQDRSEPLIMGVGRLSEQKDFVTLIRAFALLCERLPSKLIILGEGKKRAALESLVGQLNLQKRVLMPGFQSNVGGWLKHADVFVLSSRWEGSPNALTESLALGVPCVSTRCPSGPDEILQGGKYGPLVDVGDHTSMAHSIAEVIAEPLPAAVLQSAVAEYRCDASAERYLAELQVS